MKMNDGFCPVCDWRTEAMKLRKTVKELKKELEEKKSV